MRALWATSIAPRFAVTPLQERRHCGHCGSHQLRHGFVAHSPPHTRLAFPTVGFTDRPRLTPAPAAKPRLTPSQMATLYRFNSRSVKTVCYSPRSALRFERSAGAEPSNDRT